MGNHAPKSGAITDLFVRELVTAAAPKHPHFVIRTLPRHERQVRERLLAYGFSPVQLRFLPAFLFLRFHPAQRLQIAAISGVHSIVGFAAQPAPVDEDELEAWRRVSDARLAVSPAPFPAYGRPCRIGRGPLEGIRGVCLGSSSDPRVVISLSLLQRSIAVPIPPDSVSPRALSLIR